MFKKIIFICTVIFSCFCLFLTITPKNVYSFEENDLKFSGHINDKTYIYDDFKQLNLSLEAYREQTTHFVNYDRTLAIACAEGYVNKEDIYLFVYIYNPYRNVSGFKNIKVTVNKVEYLAEQCSRAEGYNIVKYMILKPIYKVSEKNVRNYNVSSLAINGKEEPQILKATFSTAENGIDVKFKNDTLIPVSKSNAFSVHYYTENQNIFDKFFNDLGTNTTSAQSLHFLNFSFPTGYEVDCVKKITINADYKLIKYSGDSNFGAEPVKTISYLNKNHEIKDDEYFAEYVNGESIKTNVFRICRTEERFTQSDLENAITFVPSDYFNNYQYSVLMHDTQDLSKLTTGDILNGNDYCGWKYEVVAAVILDLEIVKDGELINGYALNYTKPEIEDPIDLTKNDKCEILDFECWQTKFSKSITIIKTIIIILLSFIGIYWLLKFIGAFRSAFGRRR